MCHLNFNFPNSVLSDVSEEISWYKVNSIDVSYIERFTIPDCSTLNGSKSSTISIDNTPVILSKYPILHHHNMNTSNLK